MDLNRYATRTKDTPWGAFPLLNPDGQSYWFETETQALTVLAGVPDETYTLQYLPKKGYKRK